MSVPDAAVEAAAEAIEAAIRADASDKYAYASSGVGHLVHLDGVFDLQAQARAALEAAAPHMLATVSTAAELDALPRFTVIRSDEGAVFERQTMWHEAGSRDLMYSRDITLPATVLQIGWGEE